MFAAALFFLLVGAALSAAVAHGLYVDRRFRKVSVPGTGVVVAQERHVTEVGEGPAIREIVTVEFRTDTGRHMRAEVDYPGLIRLHTGQQVPIRYDPQDPDIVEVEKRSPYDGLGPAAILTGGLAFAVGGAIGAVRSIWTAQDRTIRVHFDFSLFDGSLGSVVVRTAFVFFAAAAILAAAAGTLFAVLSRRHRRMERAPGTVIGRRTYRSEDGGRQYFRTLVRFVTDEGRIVEATLRNQTVNPIRLGSAVPLLYNPDAPENARIDRLWNREPFTTVYRLVAIAVLALLIWFALGGRLE